MQKISVIVFLIMLSGCAVLKTDSQSMPVMFNPLITGNLLEVSIMSNGCTEAKHFYLKVSGDEIELRRAESDLCRAAPHLVRLQFENGFGSGVYQFKNETRFSNRVERR